MMTIDGDELLQWEPPGFGPCEEKVLVMVRLRPLNEKEVARNEISVLECIDETTILLSNGLHVHSGNPTAFKFDKVFRGGSSTKEVYEQGAKDVVMSVVSGINSTIFAYGQTSSGKTYTMNGIADYTVSDIYDYIHKHDERAFVLKFSAIEIYNEVVRDLLNSDNHQLKLLDDPERGTVVEKLTEITLQDSTHLRRLLSMCEAQRRTGETPLNETSSRSHQILKISIESSSREFFSRDKSTTISASVSFVDLAGSERASFAVSSATRLKEGCHINRSLLALGTVIRKLSKGNHGHINYRDSKLTRILQPSLGGNARTSVICTLSPAKSQVEQSKNTLMFATCAKEVSTKAQVNVVLSDKALVTYLQKELARLESELRSSTSLSSPSDYPEILREKNMQILKLENEIRELTKQRRLAESRVHDLLQLIGNIQASGQLDDNTWENEDSKPKSSQKVPDIQIPRQSQTSNIGGMWSHDLVGNSNRVGVEMERSNFSEISDDEVGDISGNVFPSANSVNQKEGAAQLIGRSVLNQPKSGSSYGTKDVKQHNMEKPLKSIVNHSPDQHILGREVSDPETLSPITLELNRSLNFRDNVYRATEQGLTDDVEQREGTLSEDKGFSGRRISLRPKLPPSIYNSSDVILSRNGSPSLAGSPYTGKITGEEKVTYKEETSSINASLPKLKAGWGQFEVQSFDSQVSQMYHGTSEKELHPVMISQQQDTPESGWPPEFQRLQKSIFDLWQSCQVSLVHRTHFFLLFQNDPSDIVYWEVEFKRLIFLNQSFEKNRAMNDSNALALSSRSIRHERESLSKSMKKKFTKEEMKSLYLKWGIEKHSKCRKLQLMNQLWGDTTNMNHIAESAAIVARLVRMSEHEEALKGMFQLSFKSSHPKHTLLTCNSLLCDQ
uniref:Kinesin-like protein n=1 Tax=Kalanchoe fedtschenkoi TaxID=63787 RepID=A0A7N0TCH0_KALFE